MLVRAKSELRPCKTLKVTSACILVVLSAGRDRVYPGPVGSKKQRTLWTKAEADPGS